MTLRVMPDPVVAQFVKSLRQDVHQETAEKLNTRQATEPPLVGISVFVPECHVGVGHGNDPGVCDRDAKGVASQITQDGFLALAVVLAE